MGRCMLFIHHFVASIDSVLIHLDAPHIKRSVVTKSDPPQNFFHFNLEKLTKKLMELFTHKLEGKVKCKLLLLSRASDFFFGFFLACMASICNSLNGLSEKSF